MKTASYVTSLVGTAIVAALALSGCVVSAGVDAGPGPGDGAITTEWSIGGAYGGSVCFDNYVSDIDIAIYDTRSGKFVTEVTFPCDAYAGTIDGLPDGVYDVEAFLIDETYGDAATTTAVVGAVDVYAGEESIIDVNFPASSFLY